MNDIAQQRNEQIARQIGGRPANLPYDNYRPINVPGRFAGQTLYECLIGMHPHIGESQWQEWFELGHILDGEVAVPMQTPVRAGQQFRHLFPDWIEPEIDSNLRILWEDESIIAVHKPAPLPVHPSGRFNRNTVTGLLKMIYRTQDLRVVHRLDANTTGVLLFARSATVATRLREQFVRNQIDKRYLVLCNGQPSQDEFACQLPIAKQRGPGGSRTVDPNGHTAATMFRVSRRLSDGITLLEARPKTGRTHQIRIHLWSMQMPVVGDPAYMLGQQPAPMQTLRRSDPPMCLHSTALRFIHPATGSLVAVESHLPDWLARLP